MPSPFPGVDPYIESSGRWGDFHGGMVAAMRGALNERLPEGYAAEIELYIWFHEPDARQRRQTGPDVYVTSSRRGSKGGARSTGGSATASSFRTLAFPSVVRRKHKYVRVVDLESNRVVTVIELLSPSNKAAGEDRDAYLNKRSETLAAGINLVEIDLLRGGRRLPLSEPAPEVQDYYVLVCRAWEFPRFAFQTFGLREPLPEIPIPLAPDVKDIVLPLKPCADRAYDEGKYLPRLPYAQPLSPSLRKGDSAWVRQVLAARPARDR